MEDRIIFPVEEIETAEKRMKRIALVLDDAFSMLRSAEKGVDTGSLRQADVQDELSRYRRRLLQAAEEAERIARALEGMRESFLNCEHETTRAFDNLRVHAEISILEVKTGKKQGANPWFWQENDPYLAK